MKKIFIYYSLSGNGDFVASYLKEKGFDIRKVISSDKMPQNTFLRIMTGGFLAGIGHKSKLINFDNDIRDYDEIIIGSPIWNGRLSCPINSVLDNLDLNNKRLTFILYSGSGEAPKVNEKLSQKFPQSKIIHLKEPKSNIENMKTIFNEEDI
ncbi:MAG: NAD(P)H-dependent oxidoreductase [Bacilli bacterium]|nr:NAD(P)H-dependent oxidoreductase [Bacilli bacterium]